MKGCEIMSEKGMTPEEFQQLEPYEQGHFFKTLYQCVLDFKQKPGGQEMLDRIIKEKEIPV
jgi:hypothetical protein